MTEKEQLQTQEMMCDDLLSALRGTVAALSDPRHCVHVCMWRAEMIARECLDRFEPEAPADLHDSIQIEEPAPVQTDGIIPKKLH